MLAELDEHRRGEWDVLMLSRELRSKYSSEVESRMPLQTARTGSERGVRATLKRATGPYSTQQAGEKRNESLSQGKRAEGREDGGEERDVDPRYSGSRRHLRRTNKR